MPLCLVLLGFDLFDVWVTRWVTVNRWLVKIPPIPNVLRSGRSIQRALARVCFSSASDPFPQAFQGSVGPWGLGGGRSVCLTGCWKGAERGAGSCQPGRYCEGAVPKQSTHLLSATPSAPTLLCVWKGRATASLSLCKYTSEEHGQSDTPVTLRIVSFAFF